MKYETDLYHDGQLIIVKKFALMPIEIKEKGRWLEFVYLLIKVKIVRSYVPCSSKIVEHFDFNTLEFLSKEEYEVYKNKGYIPEKLKEFYRHN